MGVTKYNLKPETLKPETRDAVERINNMNRKHLIRALLLGLVLTSASRSGPMEEDEARIIQIPKQQMGIHPRMAELMGWAIGQTEELTVLRGLQDTAELKITALSDKVTALLDDPRPLVRTTAIQTLEALDATSAADKLLKLVELPGPFEPRLVEQVQMADALLARWKDARGVKPWAARLANQEAPMPLRVSAARSLGSVPADQPTAAALLGVILNEAEPLPLRMTAAAALGEAVHVGLAGPAEQLMARGTHGRLFASYMLRRHKTDKAYELLTKLANDAEPAVQAPAIEQLTQAGQPQRLWPTAPKLIASHDPKVRLLMVKASKPWNDLQPVALLSATLDDPHPEVRNEARVVLQHLAGHENLRQPIKDSLRKWLETAVAERKKLAEYEANTDPDLAPHWRAAEQAALLTGALDDKPANPPLLALLAPEAEHPRLEVRLAAADAIRRLHVPESRAPMVNLMKRLIDRMTERAAQAKKETKSDPMAKRPDQNPDSELLAETAQTMGVWLVAEADPLCRQLIPKHPPSDASPRARASAIWTLGYLHAGKPDVRSAAAGFDSLAEELIARLFDQNPLDPEAHPVRLHSAITVGRMKAISQLELLRNRYENDGLEIQAACRWAIMHMTDEKLPPIELQPGIRRDGFIQPLDD